MQRQEEKPELEQQNAPASTDQRKPYHPPRLRALGSVAELTGTPGEGGSGPARKKKPQG